MLREIMDYDRGSPWSQPLFDSPQLSGPSGPWPHVSLYIIAENQIFSHGAVAPMSSY